MDVQLTWQQFAEINVLAPQLPGVQPVVHHVRRYGHGDAMGHMIGFVGAVERYEIDGDPALYLNDVRVGKQGVEHGRDEVLRGRGGLIRREVDARGRIIRQLERRPSVAGRDIRLTVDTELQRKVLARVAREGRAALVAIDVGTGNVVAMASSPTFDNSMMTDGVATHEWKKIELAPGKPLIDKTIRGQYPPGSTFKMVTALAGLEAGIIKPKTRLGCYGSHTLAEHRFHCWSSRGHGRVNVHRALRESCNVFFYQVAEQIGITKLSDMATRLGIGRRFDFELDQQKPGVMPTPGWKIATLGTRWFTGETLLAGIGQGFVLATPLQLAVMVARIASGRAIEPRLTLPGPGDGLPHIPSLDIARPHLEAVRKGLFAAVNEGAGTGRNAALGLAGVQMAGKTGTAQVKGYFVRGGRRVKKKPHSLFAGYAPYDSPRYAVAGIVEHGGAGAKRAAPMVRDVMQIIMGHVASHGEPHMADVKAEGDGRAESGGAVDSETRSQRDGDPAIPTRRRARGRG